MRAVLSLLLCAQASLAFIIPPASLAATRPPCASCTRRTLGLPSPKAWKQFREGAMILNRASPPLADEGIGGL